MKDSCVCYRDLWCRQKSNSEMNPKVYEFKSQSYDLNKEHSGYQTKIRGQILKKSKIIMTILNNVIIKWKFSMLISNFLFFVLFLAVTREEVQTYLGI